MAKPAERWCLPALLGYFLGKQKVTRRRHQTIKIYNTKSYPICQTKENDYILTATYLYISLRNQFRKEHRDFRRRAQRGEQDTLQFAIIVCTDARPTNPKTGNK